MKKAVVITSLALILALGLTACSASGSSSSSHSNSKKRRAFDACTIDRSIRELRSWFSASVTLAAAGYPFVDPIAPDGIDERWRWANWFAYEGEDALNVALLRSYGCACVTPLVGWTMGVLDGHTAVVTAGTTSERLLRTHVERRRLQVRILTVRDHEEAFLALESGRAEAFMMDDALLFGARARAGRPDDWEVVGVPKIGRAHV